MLRFTIFFFFVISLGFERARRVRGGVRKNASTWVPVQRVNILVGYCNIVIPFVRRSRSILRIIIMFSSFFFFFFVPY